MPQPRQQPRAQPTTTADTTLRARSPKSSRGRLRKPFKLPPPTLKQRLKAAKQSPYFYPILIVILSLVSLLLYSAFNTAARFSDTLVFPLLPKQVIPTADTRSLYDRVQEEVALKAVESALKDTWGLNEDDLPVVRVVDKEEDKVGEKPRKRTYEELKEAMGDAWDNAQLTGALNSAYRAAAKDN